MTPPCTLFSLYKALSALFKSYVVVKSHAGKSLDSVPSLNLNFAFAPSGMGIQPGLLSTICSPGYNSIVAVSYTHLTLPTNREV